MRSVGLFLVCGLALVSCGKNEGSAPQQQGAKCELSGVSFVALSGTADCANGLGGNNVTYATENAPLTREQNNIQTTVSFLADNSAVTLVTNAGVGLVNGVNVTLTRVSSNLLKAHVKAGSVDMDHKEPFVVDATKPVTFSVDVTDHGEVKGAAAGAILYIGGVDAEFSLKERFATGRQSGFIVNNSRVTEYKVGPVKHTHDK